MTNLIWSIAVTLITNVTETPVMVGVPDVEAMKPQFGVWQNSVYITKSVPSESERIRKTEIIRREKLTAQFCPGCYDFGGVQDTVATNWTVTLKKVVEEKWVAVATNGMEQPPVGMNFFRTNELGHWAIAGNGILILTNIGTNYVFKNIP